MAETTTVPAKRNSDIVRRWRPFELLDELQEEMARFWDEPWPVAFRPFRALWMRPTTWMPRTDVFEKNGNIVIKTELPGIKPEDVEVTLEEGDLVIRGERKGEEEVTEENYYRMERTRGSFYRCIPLPEGVKPEQIQATFSNGVLEITVPRARTEKPAAHKIAVTTK